MVLVGKAKRRAIERLGTPRVRQVKTGYGSGSEPVLLVGLSLWMLGLVHFIWGLDHSGFVGLYVIWTW